MCIPIRLVLSRLCLSKDMHSPDAWQAKIDSLEDKKRTLDDLPGIREGLGSTFVQAEEAWRNSKELLSTLERETDLKRSDLLKERDVIQGDLAGLREAGLGDGETGFGGAAAVAARNRRRTTCDGPADVSESSRGGGGRGGLGGGRESSGGGQSKRNKK